MACLIMLNAAVGKVSVATTASTNPTFKAASAVLSLPAVIISIALSAPINRGKRTVPPKPGMIPSLVSGSPIRA